MKNIILLVSIVSILFGCVSTSGIKTETQKLIIGPRVQHWLSTHQRDKLERLAVIVKATNPLKKYDFLKRLKGGFYTGHATFAQLKRLSLNPYVVRISAGKQKLHNFAKPQAPGQPQHK